MKRISPLFGLVFLSACGYHVVGTTGNTIPKTVQSISVPTFKNETSGFKVEQTLPAAVVRELITPTSYQPRAPNSATESHTELRGVITGFSPHPPVSTERRSPPPQLATVLTT